MIHIERNVFGKWKFHLLLLLSTIISCSSPNLSKAELELVGSWTSEIAAPDDKTHNYKYLELNEDRKGVTGIAMQQNAKTFLAMGFEITNWHVSGDTLVLDYILFGGKFSVPNRKETVIKEHAAKEYWIIKQHFMEGFNAEPYDPEIPGLSEMKFVKSERISPVVRKVVQ